MKNLLLSISLLVSSISFAQVGVNNITPKATMDITAKTTDGSKPEGLIAPRLTGDQLKSKDAQYTTDQIGAIVYVTVVPTGTPAGKTAGITQPGYYYYDGTTWQKLTTGNGISQAVMTLTDCSSMKMAGSLEKDKLATGQITLNVNVTTVGRWNLTTNTVNGVFFTGGGEFYYTGTQTITLYAQGTPTAIANPATFTVTIGSNTCSVNGAIYDLSTYTMKVLSLTPDDWNSNISNGSSTTNLRSKLSNTANFGSSGTVKVAGFSFSTFDVSGGSKSVALASQLENTNILWIGWVDNSQLDAGELNAIKTWLDQKKGIAIFHADDESHNAWITNLGYSSNNSGSASGFTGTGSISPIVGAYGNLNGAGFTISSGANRGAVAGMGTVLMIDVDDNNLTRMILNNNYVIIADIDLANNAAISGGSSFTNNNDKLYGNVFEWAVKNAPLR